MPWGGATRGVIELHTLSAEQLAIAAVAKCDAPLQVAPQAMPETLAGPVPFDALSAIDDCGSFTEGGAGAMAVVRDESIAEPLGVTGPARWCDRRIGRRSDETFQFAEPLRGGADRVALGDENAECYGRHDGPAPIDGQLQVHGAGAQYDVLPAERIDENVLDVGEGRDEDAGRTAGLLVDAMRGQAERVGRRLGQPDGMGLRCCEPRVNESSRGPTPRRRHGGRGAE